MDAQRRAELESWGVDPLSRKAMYVVSEACGGCGITPLYSGHECGDNWVREECPACSVILVEYRNREVTQAGPRCDCGFCSFCAECCLRLTTGDTGQLITWPSGRTV
jgi:hypothetical protein